MVTGPMVNSADSDKRERISGLVALWLSTIIPVIYVVKNYSNIKFDIKALSLNETEFDNATSVFVEKFEPLLQGLYTNVAAVTQLCATILALIAIHWKPHAVLLLPYVICTYAWSASVAIYLLIFVISRKPRPVNAFAILTCVTIYVLIVLHGYFAHIVFQLCIALNQERGPSVSPTTNKDESDLVEIPLPMSYVDLPRKSGRKPCPSVIYSDLLRKYEPYFPDVNEPEEQIIYRRV